MEMRFRRNKNELPGKKKKKKSKSQISLFLEKNGEEKVVSFNIGSMLNMARKVKALSSLNRRGWNLIRAEGEDPQKVAMFNSVAKGNIPSVGGALKFSGLDHVPKKIKVLTKRLLGDSKDEES